MEPNLAHARFPERDFEALADLRAIEWPTRLWMREYEIVVALVRRALVMALQLAGQFVR